ncbi:putative serine/threonine-protein kinase PBL21 [Drosera capensis]
MGSVQVASSPTRAKRETEKLRNRLKKALMRSIMASSLSPSRFSEDGNVARHDRLLGSVLDDDNFMDHSSSYDLGDELRRKSLSNVRDLPVDREITSNSLRDATARTFTLSELELATGNFKLSNLLGEGGFGKVAVKRRSLDSCQGNDEFTMEVQMLSKLHHPHLVGLIGSCAQGFQRLLVYEFMPKGSLADLLERNRGILDWNTRMKIAVGAARGLEYLHCVPKPAVIYRDLKSANILLDDDFNAKLSDFGLAKFGPNGDKSHVSTRVMGTYGYCAPEYMQTGQLTIKSDIFSFGVVLLELITGQRAFDTTRDVGQENLADWAHPFMNDRHQKFEIMDPKLQGRYPKRTARHLIYLTNLCVSKQAGLRPSIKEITTALEFLMIEGQGRPSNNPLLSPVSRQADMLSPGRY